MKPHLDMDKIARGLGAERKGRVHASGGFLGAMQLVADIKARFRVPQGGGRRTNPRWTERRLVPLGARTLALLERLAARMRKHGGVRIDPMQLAALLLERSTEHLADDEADELVRSRRRVRR